MVTTIVKHTVEDFEAWKPYYDDHASTRVEHSEQSYRLFQVAEDPNEVVILAEWEDAEKARDLFESSDLREVMEEAGVVDEPEIYFLNEIEAAETRIA